MRLERIFVGTDFSDQARVAADWAVALAAALGARVVVAHVFDLPIIGFLDTAFIVDSNTAARLSTEARAALDREVARLQGKGVEVEGLLRQGDARDLIPQLAQSEPAQLIVVGSHGRRGLSRALLGSVAESLVRSSSVPVTVVRSPAH
ncbi:MAG TPA: universal stress protein [Polyangiaceae bacterium]|jgi:nucleotide-binding universal stress UspA family protein